MIGNIAINKDRVYQHINQMYKNVIEFKFIIDT